MDRIDDPNLELAHLVQRPTGPNDSRGGNERTVLLVEDSAGDAVLFVKALRKMPEAPEVVRATDAGEAWEQVQRYLAGPRHERPALMVLDIGLPGDTGLDVLERMRRDAPGADWPIVMLTSSMQPHDLARARFAGAAGYYSKPLTLEGYLRLAQSLHERYLRASTLSPA